MVESGDNLEALALQSESARRRLVNAIEEARAVLDVDLPLFVEREIKRRFIEQSDFAERLDDSVVTRLKAAIKSRGAEARTEIMESLRGDDPWLAAGIGSPEDFRSFEDNEALWSIPQAICGTVTALLKEFSFPDESAEIRYRQPSWFIDGKHMSSIAERYWRGLADIAGIEAQRSEIEVSRRSNTLKRRWDEL